MARAGNAQVSHMHACARSLARYIAFAMCISKHRGLDQATISPVARANSGYIYNISLEEVVATAGPYEKSIAAVNKYKDP